MKTQNYSLARTTLVALFFSAAFASAMNGQNVNQKWAQRYNYIQGKVNEAKRVGIDVKENVYVGGYSYEGQTSSDMNWAVVKYSRTGSQLWAARYGGTADNFDALYDMKVDFKLGNVYGTGKSVETGSPYSVYTTVKYNTSGIQQWVAHYNGDSSRGADASAIAIDSQGNSYVTGESFEGGTQLIATVKYDSSGVQQWVARYSLGVTQAGIGQQR